MAINNIMPSINNFLKGFQNNLPGMKDYRHATRLFLDDNFKLAPKQKFLFHVIFDLDERLMIKGFSANEQYQLNTLVKNCELPRYGFNLEEKIQYNKKMYAATRIQYEPVNITFHDDNADIVNAFWKKYYEYNIADPNLKTASTIDGLVSKVNKDSQYDYIGRPGTPSIQKMGMDVPKKRRKPYLKSITIFVLRKQEFTSMQLVNPVIGSFSHDNVDHADGTGIMANTMQVFYETVLYASGSIEEVKGRGFAKINYDKEPSPLSVFGRGTNSIFGPGGVVGGISSAIGNFLDGNVVGGILAASNTYNNLKKIKKENVKDELRGIAKKGINEIRESGSTNLGLVQAFALGKASTELLRASPKGTVDNNTGQLQTQLNNIPLDSTIFLTADEAFNLVSNNEAIKDQVAAGIYFKDIGSRKGLTVAESDVEYSESSDTTKAVYRSKTITNIRKLVTEGYIRIQRASQDVNITVERANL